VSPVEFIEQPQGTPSVYVESALGVGYCTPSDVASLNKARAIGTGQGQPTLLDLQTYILMGAGQINAILVNKGYSVPVNVASWPEAAAILNLANAEGAYYYMERAAPNSAHLELASQAWDAAKEMLADAKFVLNADMDQQRSEPRGPWVTMQPTGQTYDPFLDQFAGAGGDGMGGPAGLNSPQNPYFSRQQKF
jgi:hypothetical protein